MLFLKEIIYEIFDILNELRYEWLQIVFGDTVSFTNWLIDFEIEDKVNIFIWI